MGRRKRRREGLTEEEEEEKGPEGFAQQKRRKRRRTRMWRTWQLTVLFMAAGKENRRAGKTLIFPFSFSWASSLINREMTFSAAGKWLYVEVAVPIWDVEGKK